MHNKHLEHGPRIPTPRPRVRDGRKAAASNWNRALTSWKYSASFPRAPPRAERERPQWINCQHFHHWLVSRGLLASPVWGIFVWAHKSQNERSLFPKPRRRSMVLSWVWLLVPYELSAQLQGKKWPSEQYEKAKRYDTERWTPQVSRLPIYYWRRVEE